MCFYSRVLHAELPSSAPCSSVQEWVTLSWNTSQAPGETAEIIALSSTAQINTYKTLKDWLLFPSPLHYIKFKFWKEVNW